MKKYLARQSAMGMCLMALGAVATGEPLAPASLNALQVIEDVEISPDGSRVVYELTRTDVAQDKYERDLWLIEGEKDPRPFVTGAGDDSRPRWSPDGKRLAFVSTRQGRPQIFVLEMSGGEAWRLTNEPSGVGGFAWAPDSSRIAYLARPAMPAPKTAAKNAPAGADPAILARTRALVTDRLFFRMDGVPGFLPDGRSQLFVTEARPNDAARIGPLTDGHAEPSEPVWSPDGQWLFFSAMPTTWEAEVEFDTELYRVPAAGGAEPEAITAHKGNDDAAIVSRSGLLALTGHDAGNPHKSAYQTELYVMKPDGTGRRTLTRAFDRNVGEVQGTDAAWLHGLGQRVAFTPNGKELLFLSGDDGLTRLYRVDVDGGEVREVPNLMRGDLREISVADNGKMATIFGSPTQPFEVWTSDGVGKPWRQRTGQALAMLPGVKLSAYEQIETKSFDGQRIQGWLVKPPDFDPARKYPLILYIHGGPHAMYGENFYHEFQVLSNAGYILLLSNPRGSTGYGQEFANSVQYTHPGDDAHRDLMAIVDAAVARGYVDERRLGIAGGSAGGTLTAWAVGRTDRFAAALVERPAVNWYSFVPGADAGVYFVPHWFRDFPWRDPEDYLRRSPITLVDNVKTPVLVIQSIEDYRTTVDQGQQYYSALKMLGKPARLALFPLSSHSLSRNGPPSQRVQRLEIILQWFDEKLQQRPDQT
ncbi:S9 family peptidase [Peristeroidobacter agariperforans]|uniref:S9 family peptidase n=1 Tax=Peristeroidobacter agariperforans TaxID=268404 RepID=UPI00101C5423|nr:S9 family peptidase [Peristeroidobacter agariperforans]